MKINEVFFSDSVKLNRKAFTTRFLACRTHTRQILVIICGALLCAGCFYFGQESNKMALQSLEKKLDLVQTSFETQRRARRDLSEEKAAHHVEKRQSRGQEVLSPKRPGGATYVRWGRRGCPVNASDTVVVYEGVAAGSHYTHTGGGANVLCTDLNVTYSTGHYRDGNSGSSYLYGLQYYDSWSYRLFDMSDIESGAFYQYDIPCAVCLANGRNNQLMIPGRETCPGGWTKEYSGYIFGSAHGHKHSTDYICIDEKPQVVPGSDGDQGGGLMYMVETQCPSLQCGPYVTGRELRCVVCTI